jgi:hypothetical protein
MLAPVVMGTIAQQQGTRSLDASGVASLLKDQKDHIMQALPSGFGSLLGNTGLLGSIGDMTRTATAAGDQTARVATSGAHAIGDAGQRAAVGAASAAPNWLYWLIPALALAAFLFYYVARPTEQVVQQGVTSAQSVMVGGLDVGKQISDNVAGLRTSLTGITDVASAQAALPKLQDLSVQIDKIGRVIGALSAEQRKVVAGLVNPLMPTLNQLFDKLLAIPGIAEVLRPTIDTLKGGLSALAS